MIIEILGIGCGACRKMELEVREIVQQMLLDAQVEHVEDLEKILQAGLTALPGLRIDGRVVEFFTQTKVVVERWPKEWNRKF